MPRPSPAGGALLLSGLLGVALLALILAVRGDGSWEASEGVYALTARALLEGRDVWGDVVVAQPPPTILAGAGILAIDDSLDALRLGMGLVTTLGAVLGAALVWRTTGSRVATALAAPAALLAPWTVHDAGALTPELLAPPLLLAGLLLVGRPERAPLVGALAAACAFVKVPYLLPALVLVACSADRARAARWAAGVLAAEVVVATAVLGGGLWRDVVLAQGQSGLRSVRLVAESGVQAGWTIGWLLLPAAVAVLLRARVRDPRLLLAGAAVALGMLATAVTTAKQGTGLNVLGPAEALLVPLAVTGVWVALRAQGRRGLRVAALAGLAMVLAQGVTVLARPQPGFPFLRPGLSGAYGVLVTEEEVRSRVAAARACDPALPHSGIAFVAFLAGRRMPGGQPDGFLVDKAERLRDVRARVAADAPRCP